MMSESKKGGLFVNKKTPEAAGKPASAASLKPKDVKKRWLYVGMGAIGVAVVSTSLFSDKPEKKLPAKKESEAATISVTPAKETDKEFSATMGPKLEELRQETLRLRADMERKDKELEELKNSKSKDGSSAANPMPPDSVAPPPALNSASLKPLATPVTPPPQPVVRPPVDTAGSTQGMPAGASVLPNGMTPPMPGGGFDARGADPVTFEAPARKGKEDKNQEGSEKSAGQVSAKRTYKPNDKAGMLPAGAFASVALLNGLDAGTSQATQANPMPVLLDILDQAVLPGAAKYKLKSCFVLGNGYGEMSSERVYVRISRLSCVDKKERIALSEEIAGYLVDSDGKLGMRGVVTDKLSTKVGKALLAEFARGLSGVMGTAQSNVLNNLSTGTTTQSLSGSAALRASGLAGAQAAMSQLADFYLKEAQSMFPVITVDAGRKGTIVFTSSVNLSWANSEDGYVEQITPINK